MTRNFAVALVAAVSVFASAGAFAGAQLSQSDSRNGCVADEAYVSLADRDTCFPAVMLPPELTAYLDR